MSGTKGATVSAPEKPHRVCSVQAVVNSKPIGNNRAHDFGQAHFRVVMGMDVPEGNVVSSIDFDATRMVYGNAFEAFASSVDILAYKGRTAVQSVREVHAEGISQARQGEPFRGICFVAGISPLYAPLYARNGIIRFVMRRTTTA